MKLGVLLGYSGKQIEIPLETIKIAESIGYDSVWTAEAYGSDAITPAAWILAQTEKIRVGTAIMQMPGRTPAMAAMTAMTLSQLSNGRFIVGLGASGPQVVEGWHGVPYGKPVSRTREYIKIMRQIMAREGKVTFDGKVYQLPNQSPEATGLGKPLKSILEADTSIPFYTAAITPAGIRCGAEVADGFIPVWMDPEKFHLFEQDVNLGFSKALPKDGTNKSLKDFDVAPFVAVAVNDDLATAYDSLRPFLALYIGGMGAKNKNFYNDYAIKLGYEEAAETVQELYLAGKPQEAAAAIPDALVDEVALAGPRDRIRERLARWKEAGNRGEAGSMLLTVDDKETMEMIAKEML